MRLKIIAGNLIVLLLVGLGSYIYLKGQIEEGLGSTFDRDVGTDRQLFERSWRLSAVEFVDQVSLQAATREVRGSMRALDANSRRRAAHDRANSIAAWFQDPARGRVGRPDIVLLTDETGTVIARDQDANRMSGRSMMQEIPTLRGVLANGIAAHDAWMRTDENKLLQIGMAPVRNDEGGVVGALIVGYDISNGVAERQSDLLGREVVFVRNGTVYSASVGQSETTALQTALGGDLGGQLAAATAGGASGVSQVDLGGVTYSSVAAALPSTPSQDVVFMVLGNRTEALSPSSALNILLLLVGLGALLIIVYGFMVGTSFLRPVEQIEEAILSVINGQTETRIDVESAEFGGLAYRINQLINMFTGQDETDADGHTAGGDWAQETAAPATDGTTDDDELAGELADEETGDYQERIYQEYVAAKQGVGEDVSNIPKDRFIGRLEKNAENLVKKHGCRMVRFQVQTKGSQVILRPVIIR
ncbi:MAG: HAMP domain-containing protein [Myxococcota bacterium]|jgi:HAMP domain-containing protein